MLLKVIYIINVERSKTQTTKKQQTTELDQQQETRPSSFLNVLNKNVQTLRIQNITAIPLKSANWNKETNRQTEISYSF